MKLLLILGFAFLAACSVKKDLDSMKATTENMERTTGKMAATTDSMSASTEEIKTISSQMYHGSREVFTTEQQYEHFHELVHNPGLSAKLKHASAYLSAFEFQHWQGTYHDDEELREDLFEKAIRTFFVDIEDMVDDKHPVSTPWTPEFVPVFGKKQENWNTLSAISSVLDRVHLIQYDIAEVDEDFRPQSFYSLIIEGLKSKKDYESGKRVEPWKEAVLVNYQIAVYLLQLRHNFLPILVAAKLSDIEDSFLNKVKNLVLRWQVNIEDYNEAQWRYWNGILLKASQTQNDLLSLGIELEENAMKKRFFSKMQFVTANENSFNEYYNRLGMDPMSVYDYKRFQGDHDVRGVLKFQGIKESSVLKLIVRLNLLTGSSLHVISSAALAALEEPPRYHTYPVFHF